MKAKIYGALCLMFFNIACKKSTEQMEIKTQACGTTIQFSGYTWTVKHSGSELYGPGPNIWNQQNVWVDANGWLHLKISKNLITNKWECAEVQSTTSFGYGTYEWQVDGAVNALDKQVVLGLFNYNGQDGLHEMDIEFARWGLQSNQPLNYTVYPTSAGRAYFHTTYDFAMSGTYTTHRFTRTNNSVVFKALGGFQNGDTNLFQTAACKAPYTVSTLKMPIYMNLWLFQGLAPTNNAATEIIIHSFKFTP